MIACRSVCGRPGSSASKKVLSLNARRLGIKSQANAIASWPSVNCLKGVSTRGAVLQHQPGTADSRGGIIERGAKLRDGAVVLHESGPVEFVGSDGADVVQGAPVACERLEHIASADGSRIAASLVDAEIRKHQLAARHQFRARRSNIVSQSAAACAAKASRTAPRAVTAWTWSASVAGRRLNSAWRRKRSRARAWRPERSVGGSWSHWYAEAVRI